MQYFENNLEKLTELAVLKLVDIAIGLFILLVGKYVIRFAIALLDKRFEKKKIDLSIRTFISSLLRFVLYALLILTVANTMGVQTTSFIAALSAFGLAVGMALQGSLSNFAGGVLVLVFRPFEVGDYIDSANGSIGTVEKIDLLYTTLINDDGIKIFSPNGTLANSVIKNFTKISARRLQFQFIVSYDMNMKEVKAMLMDILQSDQRILNSPAPKVFVNDLKDSGVDLIIRAWSKREDFGDTKEGVAEKIHAALEGKGHVFPQTSIKVIN